MTIYTTDSSLSQEKKELVDAVEIEIHWDEKKALTVVRY